MRLARPASLLLILITLAGWIAAAQADDPPAWNAASLVEIRTLADMPQGVRAALTNSDRASAGMADVGQAFNPTDVMDARPRRRFIVGGSSDNTALVVYEAGGIALFLAAIGYIQVDSHWSQARQWNFRTRPTSLQQALALIAQRAHDDRGTP